MTSQPLILRWQKPNGELREYRPRSLRQVAKKLRWVLNKYPARIVVERRT
jgi:hypothetical protein